MSTAKGEGKGHSEHVPPYSQRVCDTMLLNLSLIGGASLAQHSLTVPYTFLREVYYFDGHIDGNDSGRFTSKGCVSREFRLSNTLSCATQKGLKNCQTTLL
jgi:hypothetical protein